MRRLPCDVAEAVRRASLCFADRGFSLQAASCQRRARGVTDEAFQTGSVVAVDAGGRMQRKAAGGETQGGPAHRLGNIAQQTPHTLAGAFAGGQRHMREVDSGRDRRIQVGLAVRT